MTARDGRPGAVTRGRRLRGAIVSACFGSVVLAGLVLLSGCGGGSEATSGATTWSPSDPEVRFAADPLELRPLECASAILIEPRTNTVLYEQNPHDRRAPASIVKMTHELVVLREVEAGRIDLDDSVRVSAWASRIGGSQVYLAQGEVFPLRELMKAIAIHSANDACVAVAEHVAGSADGFVRLMNQEVEGLRLENTHYINVHGLDDEPGTGNQTTAWDIARIARELIRYPEVLQWSSIREAPFRGGEFILQNTNHLVGRYPGLDGLKTGYTEKAGWCLCATAERNGLRLISVVLGAPSDRARVGASSDLLSAGFNSYVPVEVCQGGEVVGESVIAGAKDDPVQVRAPRGVTLLVARLDERSLEKAFVPADGVRAPLKPGDEIGHLQVRSRGRTLAEIPVVVTQEVRAAGFVAWLKRLVGQA